MEMVFEVNILQLDLLFSQNKQQGEGCYGNQHTAAEVHVRSVSPQMHHFQLNGIYNYIIIASSYKIYL